MSNDNRPLPMGERVRRAGPQAVPLLVSIHIRAGAEALAAIEALGRDAEDGGPDPKEAMRRLDRILRLLTTGEP